MILHSRFEGADVAADIISAGPEPLTSQFAAGYGMVLNLLHTRSLDEARAFLERSFGNYMGEPGAHACRHARWLGRFDLNSCRMMHSMPAVETGQAVNVVVVI